MVPLSPPHASEGPNLKQPPGGKGHQAGRHTDGQHLFSAAETEKYWIEAPQGVLVGGHLPSGFGYNT